MKALLPPDLTPGTYFMAAFLLHLPHRSNAQPAGPQLAGADGRSTPTWGTIRRRLSFGLRTFYVTFLLAAVYRPILGLDFLSAHGLLVDPVGRQVLDSKARATHITVTTTQVRRRPLLHSTVGTVLVGIDPGRPRCSPGRPRCGPGRPRCGPGRPCCCPGRPRCGPSHPAAVRAAHYAAMANHTTVIAAHITDKTAHDPASATNTHDNGRPRRSAPAQPLRRGRPVAQAPPVRAPPPKQRGGRVR